MNDTSLTTVECNVLSSKCVCHQIYQFYDWHEKLVLGLIGLPVICFGLGANLLSALVFSHRLMASSPLNWYLAVLSLSDSLVLLSAFFVLALPRLGEFLIMWNSTSMSVSEAIWVKCSGKRSVLLESFADNPNWPMDADRLYTDVFWGLAAN
ncbi:hypothetical protein L596_005179 [Steinernema carpocapsae]|uniref:Uncharacterized protein n=1 Tax=Steinernema carpocapsae TaxID=34508 RepID=A0A4U8V2E7_STECR|nr:hypothetical protein L596_005179 [Steinernema carpocapsae]